MTTTPPYQTYEPPPPPPPPQFRPGFIYPTNPPRDPIVALLLNIFFFCVGYFFIGQNSKGIAGAVIFLGYLFVAVIGGVFSGGCATCLILPVGLAMNALTAVDAYQQALQLKLGRPVGEWTYFSAHY